ncbi:hypothetical protein [Thalassospira profundimaris]|nr:hypothetical protein [Thalassospira profundimaris]
MMEDNLVRTNPGNADQAIENGLSLGILVPTAVPMLAATPIDRCRYLRSDSRFDLFEIIDTGKIISIPFHQQDRHRYLIHEFDRTAAALARKPRWNGLCSVNIAQHAVQHSQHASTPAKPYALLHDNEERDIGDLITPLKHELRRLKVWDTIDTRIVLPMRQRFARMAGLEWPWPEAIETEIKIIDERLKSTEARDQVDHSLLDQMPDQKHEPYPEFMEAWSQIEARSAYLQACIELFPSLKGFSNVQLAV